MPDVTINFSLGKLRKAVNREIATLFNLISTDLIVDTRGGLTRGVNQANRAHKALARSTVLIKQERGQSLTPLIATGQMRDSLKITKHATSGSLNAIMAVLPRRSFIGKTHQTGDGVPKREWFPTKVTKRFKPQLEKDIRFSVQRLVRAVK